jgi:hypothetical protein
MLQPILIEEKFFFGAETSFSYYNSLQWVNRIQDFCWDPSPNLAKWTDTVPCCEAKVFKLNNSLFSRSNI